MGKILVIGSAVADVIIRLEDHLPVKGEDVHVLSQEMRPGGCAFNVYNMIRRFDKDVIPFFPVGTGPYADFMEKAMKDLDIVSAAPHAGEPNGCCYCFIEADGERTFIVYHGAEYRFRKEWFDALDTSGIDMCYICGLEIEEETGGVIVDFLEKNPQIRIVFAPGPRIGKIDRSLLQRIFALHSVLHLNETETAACAGIIRESFPVNDRILSAFREADNWQKQHPLPDAIPSGAFSELLCSAAAIHSVTSSTVITTLGKNGCIYCTGKFVEGSEPGDVGDGSCGVLAIANTPEKIAQPEFGYVAPYPAVQVDATGAGDAHAGAAIAMLHKRMPLPEALDHANRMAARVVATSGALLDMDF